MTKDWINSKVSVLIWPGLLELTKDGKLDPDVLSLQTRLLNLAKINATFTSHPLIGSCVNGSYNGLLGDLESNASDFALFYISLEAIRNGSCEEPGFYESVYRQDPSRIISVPETNTSRIHHDLHESFYVFDATFIWFMLATLVFFLCLVRTSARVNNRIKSHAWNLIRIWLHQDVNDDGAVTQSIKTILTTNKLLMFYVLLVMCNIMNVDLVSSSKPTIINTIADAIESNIRLVLVRSSTALPSIMAQADGSEAKQLILHAMNQSADGNVFFPRGDITVKLRERSVITILQERAITAIKLQECIDPGNDVFYHESSQEVLLEHAVILYSKRCPPEVVRRNEHVNRLAMEGGLYDKHNSDFWHQTVFRLYNAYPNPYCLHRDKHQHNHHSDQKIKFHDLLGFLVICFRFCGISFTVLIIEQAFVHFQNRHEAMKERERISMKKSSRRENEDIYRRAVAARSKRNVSLKTR